MPGNNDLIIRWLNGRLTPVVYGPIHHSTHVSKAFMGGFLFSGSAAGASNEILLITFNSEINLRFAVHSGGDAYTSLIEEPTVVASGTYLPVMNRNRNSGDTLDMLAFRGSTTTGGTSFPTGFIPGGSGGQAVGGHISEDDEILLKKNSRYSLRAKNVTAQNQDICIVFDAYVEVGDAAHDS